MARRQLGASDFCNNSVRFLPTTSQSHERVIPLGKTPQATLWITGTNRSTRRF